MLRVVVKRDDGINDGKIRMFATLESCKGNACGTLERQTTVYIVEKGRGRGRGDFHQRVERWRQGWAHRGAIQKAERKPFLGRDGRRFWRGGESRSNEQSYKSAGEKAAERYGCFLELFCHG